MRLSGTDDPQLAEDALRSGADGFVSKAVRPEALAGPLYTIAAGMRVVDTKVLEGLLSNIRKPPGALLDALSPADLKLWVLLSTGMETVDIAMRMLVSERTAKRMVASLLNKLGVTTGSPRRGWPDVADCSTILQTAATLTRQSSIRSA